MRLSSKFTWGLFLVARGLCGAEATTASPQPDQRWEAVENELTTTLTLTEIQTKETPVKKAEPQSGKKKSKPGKEPPPETSFVPVGSISFNCKNEITVIRGPQGGKQIFLSPDGNFLIDSDGSKNLLTTETNLVAPNIQDKIDHPNICNGGTANEENAKQLFLCVRDTVSPPPPSKLSVLANN